MLRPAKTYADAFNAFRWDIPVRYNIEVDVIDKHVVAGQGGRLALVHELESGAFERLSFDDIARKSNQLADLLVAHGIRPRDRVAILLPQRPETGLSRCRAASAKCRCLKGCQAAATAVRQVSIAAARSVRCVWAEVRWRWTLKVL